jgi:hypothetical protein
MESLDGDKTAKAEARILEQVSTKYLKVGVQILGGLEIF